MAVSGSLQLTLVLCVVTQDLWFQKITARGNVHMLPFTFQNVSLLSTHVNFSCRPVRIHKGSGSCFRFCPRPCLTMFRRAMLATHRHIGPHSVCIPCSHLHLGGATTAYVSYRQRDWAVSSGSHMQQDMWYFLGASTSRRSVSFG